MSERQTTRLRFIVKPDGKRILQQAWDIYENTADSTHYKTSVWRDVPMVEEKPKVPK